MPRPVRVALVAAALAAFAVPVVADDYAFGFNPRSGDAWIDAQLGDVNVFARGNLDGYVDEVVVSTGAPASYVRELVIERDWAPGDVFYACLIARELGRPCTVVADAYEREMRGRGRGWGVIAQELGIRPGSPEFHALKGGLGQGRGRLHGRGAAPNHGGPDARASESRGRGKGQGQGKGHGRGG